MRGPSALGQAPGSPGVLCSLEDVSLPPSAAGSPPGPVALPPGGISRHLCLAAEPGTAPTGLGGQAALGRLHGKPTPSVTDGVLCLCAWGSVHGACSADAGSAFLCGLELSSGAWMVGGGSARLRSHLCRWRPEDPEGRPSRPPSCSPPPVTCRARPARPRGHSFLSEHTRVHGVAGPQPRGAVYPRWFQPAQRERHTQRPRRPGSARGSNRVGTVRGHSVLRCRRFGYTGLKCIIETNCACVPLLS